MRRTGILGKGQSAGIDDELVALRIRSDDGGEYRGSAIIERACADSGLEGVVEDIVARPDLVGRLHALDDRQGRRRADAPNHAVHSPLRQPIAKPGYRCALRGGDSRDLLPTRGVVGMPGVGEQTSKANSWRIGHSQRQVEAPRIVRIDPGAVIAAIDLEKDVEHHRVRGRERLNGLDCVRAVDEKVQRVDGLSEGRCTVELLRRDRNGVGNVTEPVRGEELCFGESGYRDGAGLSPTLHSSDLECLVCLHMGPEEDARVLGLRSHPIAITAHPLHVDEEKRRGGTIRDSHG